MSKWHVKEEFAELFANKPPQRVGWCLVDDDGNYYEEPPGDTWIVLDREDAQDFADQLNGERDG